MPASCTICTIAPLFTMDDISRTNRTLSLTPAQADRKRRKREGVLIVVITIVVAFLTLAEFRVIHFGSDIPVSNTILMFILININLLLLILPAEVEPTDVGAAVDLTVSQLDHVGTA